MPGNLESPSQVSRTHALCNAALLFGLLLLFDAFPYWVGLWAGPALDWRFLPLLAPDYAQHLGPLTVWLLLSIALQLLLARRRRWDRTSRWLQFVGGAVGALTLAQIAAGPRMLGPDEPWLERHGWPAHLQPAVTGTVQGLYPLFQLLVTAAFFALTALSIYRLARLLGWAPAARRLVREGLGDRGLGGTLDLFRQDAGRAYDVLDRDRAYGEEPQRPVGRWIHRAKVVLRGIAEQLTPARRLLFAASMVLAIPDKTRWLAVAGLFFLLLFELVDRIRVMDELELARALQRDLLPSAAPEVPGWSIAHSYRTANAIGGDYYDFQPAGEGRTALVVSDASGHGMAAALIMAIANATLKAAVAHEPQPERVVTQLNRALFRTGGRRSFMTLFYGLLQPATGRLDYLSAGHPFPLLRRADGEVVELGRGSLPLGITEELELGAQTVEVEPGDRLLLYSDGLPEALDGPDGESFGFVRLRELLAEGGKAQEIHDRVLAAFDAHLGDQPLSDDLTVVVLARHS